MQFTDFSKLDLYRLPSPCFVIDEVAVERNLSVLHDVQERSGAKVLQALKAFSMWSLASLSKKYLSGTCASGLHEARLGFEHYGGEVHVFSAAFSEQDLIEILTFADHVVFNTCSQLERFAAICKASMQQRPELRIGLRINPEHSEGEVAIYDPCAEGSRLGTTRAQLDQYLAKPEFIETFSIVSGLHFHTLCEQDFLPLERTLNAVEAKFGDLLGQMEWVNFGGGHHITRPDYQVEDLISRVIEFRHRYSVAVYLEPGEAVAIGTGVLVSEVLDIGFNQLSQLILDTSATCHMPDTLEMPYRPDIMQESKSSSGQYRYRLGGLTCLAGDVIGDYAFDREIRVGDRLVFEDMAHYTMVKTSTFNGTKLPAIVIWNSISDELNVIREFGYEDFMHRLS